MFEALMMVPREGGNPMMIMLVQMVLFGAIFYFLLIAPQKKQQNVRQTMLAGIKKGDEIVTNGGIVGRVIQTSDHRLTIKSGESTLEIDRVGVARVMDGKSAG